MSERHDGDHVSDRDFMKNILKGMEKYRSFTTFDDDGQRKVYDLNMTQTASGLLRDAAVTTRQLNTEQRKQKKYALEVFAAYCMHICAVKVARAELGDVFSDVYQEILNWLKKDWNNGHQSFKKYLANRAHWRCNDILKKDRIILTDENGKSYRVGRFQPLEAAPGEDRDDEPLLNPEVTKKILETAARKFVKDARRETVDQALEQCLYEKKLTQEQVDILCRRYGLGDGYEPMKLAEIARKMDRPYAVVYKSHNGALAVLGRFIRQNKWL